MFYLHAKKKFYPSPSSWTITKIFQTCYFRYFEHAWPRPSTAKALACRKLWILSTNKKLTWSFNFFDRYYTLKNPAIWLAKNILDNTLEQEFCQTWCLLWKVKNQLLASIAPTSSKKSGKPNEPIMRKTFQ